ncbi:MAG: ribbon-helix-helix domain-containing protein [Acetobacteraceae bacterium]
MGKARRDDPARRDPRGRRLSGLVKRSFSLAGHRTSVALEDEFWEALGHIAAERGKAVSAIVAEVDAARTPDRPLASALRVVALRRFFTPPTLG